LNHRIFQTRSAGFSTLPPRGRLASVTGPFPQPLLIKRAIFSWYLILEKDGCYRKCRGGPVYARAIKPRLYLLGTYVAGTAPTPVEIASMGRSSALRGRAYAGPPLHLDFVKTGRSSALRGRAYAVPPLHLDFVKTGRSSAYGAGRTLVSLYTCECGVDEEIIAIWRPGVRWSAPTPVNMAAMGRSSAFGARAYADLPLRLSYGQLVLGIALPRYAVTDRPDHLLSVARRAANPIVPGR
jgi:hypothetical protein